MGKRITSIITEPPHTIKSARSIRKRKCTLNTTATDKAPRFSNSTSYWLDNHDEDSSSNDSSSQLSFGRNTSTKQANNSSILLNNLSSLLDASVHESPKPVYTLRPSLVNGTVLHDLTKKPWRLGTPIGKGNFGEIFLASDNIEDTVTNENANFVVKIEPHSNGPLFVEIHCLMNTVRNNTIKDEKPLKSRLFLRQEPPSGIPEYIASGSHYFGDARYRFLVLQRFDRDLHSLIKNCRVSQKHVLTLAIHIVTVLEKLHDKGYCHNDVKAQNVMISKCKYYKQRDIKETAADGNSIGKNYDPLFKVKYDAHDDEKQQTTDSGNSSEQDPHEEDEDVSFVIKRKTRKYDKYHNNDEDDEDFDDGATSQSNNSNSMDIYETPLNKNRKQRQRTTIVEYSGSNPVRSCRRRQQPNSIYEEMVKSHYLRPTKRISYSEFFNEDTSAQGETPDIKRISSDDESEEFFPQNIRRTAPKSKSLRNTSAKRLTRQQEKQQQQCQTTLASSIDTSPELTAVEEERIFLIDFGLASKFMDKGVHRPFVMDQRRAHDGTLEFTSRDAHMGAHSRRSDLECLGYNLIFWSQGYLPWKDAASQHQQEKVHRAKEYLMTDVREMLREIYGRQVPKYLGEFLHYVGKLAYHERPDYERYRRLFEREYEVLGYSPDGMQLKGDEIMRTCVRFKEEIENKKDIFEMNKTNPLSIMKNLTTLGTPFHERTLSNRVSPKNLRSKSEKKATKKKKFSWAEILSQDPDQIARERAEKEFDREEELSDAQPTIRRYQGRPTYAILEVQQRMKLHGRIVASNSKGAGEAEEDPESIQQSEKYGAAAGGKRVRPENDEVEDDSRDDDEYDDNEASDTDSDYMEQTPQTKSWSRMTTRGLTTATKTRKYTPITNSRATTTGRKGNSAQVGSHSMKSKQTRTRSSTTLTTLKISTTSNSSSSSKRGGVGRSNLRKTGGAGRTVVASAAGEAEAEREETGTFSCAKYHQSGMGSTCVAISKPTERRTRRCLIKTETETATGREDRNSNFSPNMRGLFNVWKRINNESTYAKGISTSTASSAKHFKK